MENPKSGDPGTCTSTFSEKVPILGMRGVRSRDFVYRPGFVSDPVNRTLICGDFLFNPRFKRSFLVACVCPSEQSEERIFIVLQVAQLDIPAR